MNVFLGLDNLPKFSRTVVTIGSFDGVHAGHQQLFGRIKALANEQKIESVVITFDPHPRKILYPNETSPKLLTTTEEKVQLISDFGIHNLVVVAFNSQFSNQTAEEYISNFLVQLFDPQYIVIGYDHKFGAKREGDFEFLKNRQTKYNFEVIEIPKEEIDHIAVSSTKIRKALDNQDITSANQQLNYHFSLSGTVVKGQQIGRTIGYPTANIEITDADKIIPADGIYAVFAHILGKKYSAMLYIGKRPTLQNFENRTIEVNIFDFDKDIYGQKLSIEFVTFLRKDEKFNGLDALKAQLAKDKIDSLKVLSSQQASSVAIVILNYNGKKYLEKFLSSLIENSQLNKVTIFVADNASTDDSLLFLQNNYKENIKVIKLNSNLGFAGGYQAALKQVTADYYLLLNSDVEVSKNWLQPLIQLLDNQQNIAACQPKIRSFKNPKNFEHAGAAGGWIDKLGYPFCRGRIFNLVEEDNGQYDSFQNIAWATGACLLIRANIYHKFGGFDEDYFAHMEEIDLCWRIRRAGYSIAIVPESVVCHVGGGTLDYEHPQKIYLNFRNSLFTLLKNEPVRKLIWLLPLRIIILDFVAGAKFLLEGRPKNVWAVARAHWSFFRYFFKTIQKRQKLGVANQDVIYDGSIVWQFFINKKQKFSELFR